MWNRRIIVWLTVVNYYWFIKLRLVRMLIDRFVDRFVFGAYPLHFPTGRLLVACTMLMRLRIGLRRRGHLFRLVDRRIFSLIRHVTGNFMLLIIIRKFIDRRLFGGRRKREKEELEKLIGSELKSPTYLLFNWLIFTNSLLGYDRRLPIRQILVIFGYRCVRGVRWRMMRLAGHLLDRLLCQRNHVLLFARSRILNDRRVPLTRLSNRLRCDGGRLRNHLVRFDRILDRHIRIDLVRHHVVWYGGGRTDRSRNRSGRTLLVGHSIGGRHLLWPGGHWHHLPWMKVMRIECGRLMLFFVWCLV